MYSSMTISNFRGLSDLRLDSLAPVTLLSGKNNTGKSAVLEALFLNACGAYAAQHGASTVRAFRGDGLLNLDATGESSPWDALFTDYESSKPIQIHTSSPDEDLTITMESLDEARNLGAAVPLIQGAGVQTVTSRLAVGVARRARGVPRNERFVSTLTATITQGMGVGNISVNFSLDKPADPPKLAFIIGARNRANQQELADRYSRLKRRGRDQDLFQILKLVEPRLRAIEILVDQGQPALHFNNGGSVSYPLTLLGEGTSSIVDFVTAIHAAPGGVVLIDEIENGIHHSILGNLWDSIHRAAERTKTQIVATTHSQECVQAAYSALQKRKDRLRLIRLRRKDELLRATSYDIENLSGAIDGNLDLR